MSIICQIFIEIQEIIINGRSTPSDAVFIAPVYMNRELKKDDIDSILLFSEKLEKCTSPMFKSLYDDEVNNAIWTIVCWSIRITRMMNELSYFLNSYMNCNFEVIAEFTNDYQLIIKGIDCYNQNLFIEKLDNYYGKDLFAEVCKKIYCNVIVEEINYEY